jgi:hypothetical protein
MDRLKFFYNEYEVLGEKRKSKEIDTSPENILLYYFFEDFDEYMFEEYLPQLEAVQKGELSFDEVEDGFWVFGEGVGNLYCDESTAYFEAQKTGYDPNAPSIEMSMKELIRLLKKWQAFLLE